MDKAQGKALREKLPRSQQGAWAVKPGREEVLSILSDQEQGRLSELLPLRHARMAASPFAFYRGSAALMAADLATLPTTGISVQLCGDAHIANFGGFRSLESHLVFDINDFDETLPGPWEWDVKRMATSVEICGRQRGFGHRWRRRAVKGAVKSYREAMREFAQRSALAVWRRYIDLNDTLRQVRKTVRGSDRKAIARQLEAAYGKNNATAFERLVRVSDGVPKMVYDPPSIVPLEQFFSGDGAKRLRDAMEALLVSYRASLPPEYLHLFDQYRFLDGAMKVVGVGSVGMRAWVAALTDKQTGHPLVLQMKQARASVLEPFCGASAFPNSGQRVICGQRLMQSTPDRFLGWARLTADDGTVRDYYVRQLWNWKMSIDYAKASASQIEMVAQLCGWTLARAHARSGDRGAIAAYIGAADTFDNAIADFARAYARQNEEDYQVFLKSLDIS
ncbi:DUF2252 domain-containing protein [Adlercreutzia murintestinalis]|uniref:DUF2252 domain-containing protein n=1 Tax=Adlercreutzia murintestinalis TaxID=2941325 RepID=UPI00203D8040|nr:DUF2252 domain-containing protein [Adlercreutzia murintestinalis]